MAIDAKSYLLVKLNNTPGAAQIRPGRGHVVSVRDVSVPLGSAERPPEYIVIHSDRTVAENQYLLEQDGYWRDLATNNPEFEPTKPRKRRINISAMASADGPLTGLDRAEFVKKLMNGQDGVIDFIPAATLDAETIDEAGP